ncbi:MAG: OadG family protein [Paludibacter sp.]|nr:OadG family protein [Paludibacter sp.]
MELLEINWTNTMIIVGLGFGIVFVILTLLVIILNIWQKINAETIKQKKNAVQPKKVEHITKTESNITVITAIAVTLYLYFECAHDFESGVVTIKSHRTEWNSNFFK